MALRLAFDYHSVMRFSDVRDKIVGIPFTSPERGRELYDHIIASKPQRCLELGFAHGVASCYIAAALHENGGGHLDCIDMPATWQTPSIETLLERCGLTQFVTPYREVSGYTWHLKREIERQPRPTYDFCFIDGPKSWDTDGLAFFLVDTLLTDGGWIVFDDYSYARGADVNDEAQRRRFSPDALTDQQIKSVFHLLVMQHPSYSNFRVVNEQRAWAQKTRSDTKVFQVVEHIGVREKALRLMRRLLRR